MTREIAIRYCDEYLARRISDIDRSFLEIAKEALQQEPCDKCVYSTSEGCQHDDITETIPPFETSDDAISRQATIEYLCINMNWHDENGETADDEEKLNAITDLVNGVPPVTPQTKQEPKTGWIPVSERLPEIHQDVLLSLRSLDVEVGFRGSTEPYYYCHGGYIDPQNVLAWQPLPEPYTAEGGEAE